MPIHDFTSERLFIDTPMSAGQRVTSSREHHNYLCNVLRMKVGDEILVFNGRDGEWRARLSEVSKRTSELTLEDRVREQTEGPQIVYIFAPLKRARLDYMVQKAVEMGAARLQPVITDHTIVGRVNVERMRANVIEAAEQCAVLNIPSIDAPVKLKLALRDWPASRPLIVADEAAKVANPIEALSKLEPGPVGLLIGPEGGFSAAEHELLAAQSFVTRISLGPRIMRADTAAVAALALVNACIGDWK